MPIMKQSGEAIIMPKSCALEQLSFATCVFPATQQFTQTTTTTSRHPPTFLHKEQMVVAMVKGRYMGVADSLFKHEPNVQIGNIKICEGTGRARILHCCGITPFTDAGVHVRVAFEKRLPALGWADTTVQGCPHSMQTEQARAAGKNWLIPVAGSRAPLDDLLSRNGITSQGDGQEEATPDQRYQATGAGHPGWKGQETQTRSAYEPADQKA